MQVVRMPHSSPWPIVLALCLSGMFAVLINQKYAVAAVFAVLAGLTLVAWHAQEPPPPPEAFRRGVPASLLGMGTFVAAEAALFAMMVGTYFYLRFKNLHWPPPGIPEPKLLVPLVLLGVLLASVVPVQLGYRAARVGRLVRARMFLLTALVVQAGYFAMEVSLFRDDLSRFTPQTHAYASIYYILLGVAHAHVAIGLLLSAWLLTRLARGLTPYRLNALQALALYWAAVGVLTVVATLTVISPAL
jgi:heme/copper-type cytochrome/quinol oxidase subunit 3